MKKIVTIFAFLMAAFTMQAQEIEMHIYVKKDKVVEVKTADDQTVTLSGMLTLPATAFDSIVYVRVIDAIGTIDPQYATYDAFGHMVNDPWPTNFASSGFDLSGVGVIHQKPVGIDNHEMPQVFAYPNPCNGTLYIINENAENVSLFDMNGILLRMVDNGETHITLNMQSYPAGLYLLKVGNGVKKILKK